MKTSTMKSGAITSWCQQQIQQHGFIHNKNEREKKIHPKHRRPIASFCHLLQSDVRFFCAFVTDCEPTSGSLAIRALYTVSILR
ncbi:hypothetical protein GCK72_002986 [Caenorhabditis remanei]|uniref:Uncharacterized protein n=1 Tax=Caenorhabditis remanei TaxID=31234 RepID=A0A6A5HSJ9_CAERE|nr:hypothetical protein GCK72_002986 [Caenorhabditis remanei]KAF1771160.1 hypothetical protein GCK72_002986 [Caenorhabditis remanei]